MDINPFQQDNLFSMIEYAIPQIHTWRSANDFTYLSVSHSGYGRLDKPVLYNRTICLHHDLQALTIEDRLMSTGRHYCCVNWRIGPHLDRVLSLEWPNAYLIGDGRLGVVLVPNSNAVINCELRDSWYSPSYGIRLKILEISYSFTIPFNDPLIWIFIPVRYNVEVDARTITRDCAPIIQKLTHRLYNNV